MMGMDDVSRCLPLLCSGVALDELKSVQETHDR